MCERKAENGRPMHRVGPGYYACPESIRSTSKHGLKRGDFQTAVCGPAPGRLYVLFIFLCHDDFITAPSLRDQLKDGM